MLGTRSRARSVTRPLLVGVAIAAAAGLLLAGCASTATPNSSKPATSASGEPDLTGKTINIALGAAPATSDTKIALMVSILQQWGADAKIVNQVGDPAAVRVVLSGDAQVGAIAGPSAINSGLIAIGPSQPRLDYHFIGASSLKKVSQLPGKIYGTSNQHGVEALAFAALLKAKHIDPSKVTQTIAGGASVRVSAMIAGHIQATFVHAQDVKTLTDQGFNDLATMSKVAPDVADSFIATTPAWYKANPDLAQAIDQAWIEAARVFNDDKAKWISAALAYAGGSKADAEDLYAALKSSDTFPVSSSAYSKASAEQQEQQAAEVGAISSSPDIETWFSQDAWDAAVKAEKIK